jgi:NAD(P)-dependent dehydrogenase (short-subunit alcohol dehydrogenase family)
MTKWTSENIPSQAGRTAVVTGTGGLGYEDALALARAGADVVIAGRNPQKGAEAVARIKQASPGAKVRFGEVDLGNLASIARFAETLAAQQDSLDILINNAGVMNPPQRKVTSDGFELQVGTNYLGHFALTGRLLPLLKKGNNPRVVTLGSIAARSVVLDFDNFQGEREYKPMVVYGQSKLACNVFAVELSRRSKLANWGISSLGAHPGVSRTDLIPNQASTFSVNGILRRVLSFMFQPVWQGALPTLYAATDPAARDGVYYGPDSMGGTRGYPKEEAWPKGALDSAAAVRLWDLSERLTGVKFA